MKEKQEKIQEKQDKSAHSKNVVSELHKERGHNSKLARWIILSVIFLIILIVCAVARDIWKDNKAIQTAVMTTVIVDGIGEIVGTLVIWSKPKTPDITVHQQ